MVRLLWLLAAACGGSPSISIPERRTEPVAGAADIVPASALDPGKCDDVPNIRLEQLAVGVHRGERVALDLIPKARVVCTDRCRGEYVLDVDGRRDLLLMGIRGCEATDDGYLCEPFGTRPTTRYRFVGTYDQPRRLAENFTFAIEKYCRVTPPST